MADRYGSRTLFRAALAVFMAGSLACAAAGSLGGFVAARFVQGMGGAMMVPVGRLVLLRSIPKNEIVAALAYLTIPAMVGPVVGPPLGGFITTYFDWRWIFFINIPIDLLGIATFRASVLGGSLFRIGVGAIPFLLPLMLQIGFGLNPLQSGLLTFVSAAGALFMKALAARILRTFGFRAVLTVNAFIAASGLFTPGTPHGSS